MSYLGNFAEDSTSLTFKFTSRNTTGEASALSSGLVDVYKGSSTSPTTAGVTLTSTFASVVGFNHVGIDLSSTSFYAVSDEYSVMLSQGEVNGVDVSGEVLASFSIDNRYVSNFTSTSLTDFGVSTLGSTEVDDSIAAYGASTHTSTDIEALLPTNMALTVISTDGEVNSDLTAINGSTSALDNFSDQYDGTGLTGDTYPATQAQINSIGSIAGGFSTPVTGATITTGSETLTYTATEGEDGVLHEIAPSVGNIDFYYELDVGESGAITAVECVFRVNSNGDTVTAEYYDYVSTSYKTIKTLNGSNSTALVADTFEIPINGTGVGANIGLGRLRFTSSTATGIDFDSVRVKYSARTGGISNGSTVTLAASAVNKNFIGASWNLALGGQDISGAYFEGANSVTGTSTSPTGEVHFNDCEFGTASIGNSHMKKCGFDGTLTGVAATDYFIVDGYSQVAGSGSPTFTFTGLGASSTINVRGWRGGGTWNFDSDCTASIEVTKGGTHTIAAGGADVEFRGFCKAVSFTGVAAASTVNAVVFAGDITVNGTGGTVNVYGQHSGITDSSGGSVTINDYSVDGPAVGTNIGTIITNLATAQTDLDTISDGIILGAAATGTLSTTQATSNLTGYTDDQLIGRIITVLTGVAAGESSDITDYVETNGLITFTAMTLAMGNGDTFKIT